MPQKGFLSVTMREETVKKLADYVKAEKQRGNLSFSQTEAFSEFVNRLDSQVSFKGILDAIEIAKQLELKQVLDKHLLTQRIILISEYALRLNHLLWRPYERWTELGRLNALAKFIDDDIEAIINTLRDTLSALRPEDGLHIFYTQRETIENEYKGHKFQSAPWDLMKTEISKILSNFEDLCRVFGDVVGSTCQLLEPHITKLQELSEKLEG